MEKYNFYVTSRGKQIHADECRVLEAPGDTWVVVGDLARRHQGLSGRIKVTDTQGQIIISIGLKAALSSLAHATSRRIVARPGAGEGRGPD
jgi:hypothetical protein